MRLVVIYGAVSDIAREGLLAEYPDRFESPRKLYLLSFIGIDKECISN